MAKNFFYCYLLKRIHLIKEKIMISSVNNSPSFNGMSQVQLRRFIPGLSDESARVISKVMDRKIPDMEMVALKNAGDGISVITPDSKASISYIYKGDGSQADRFIFLDSVINNLKLGFPMRR